MLHRFSGTRLGVAFRRSLPVVLALAASCGELLGGDEPGAAGTNAESKVAVKRAALENAIEIDTCAELQAMQDEPEENYVLVADVNCAGFDAGDGGGFRPIRGEGPGWDPFRGHFDGQGHVIRNLTINRPEDAEAGLFGLIQYGSIRNVGLENVSIHGFNKVGAIAGSIYGTEVTSVYATGFVSGERQVGGLAGGLAEETVVADSYSSVAVERRGEDDHPYGLLFGLVYDGAPTRVYSRGTSSNCGAKLVGAFESGETITSSFFDCTLAGQCTADGAQSSTALKTSAHYSTAGWDLNDVWKFDSSGTYPCLEWQASCGTTADSDSDGTANAADGCPTDPLKVGPGGCGCHVDESCLPTAIGTCAELQAMGLDLDEDYLLTADIDCEGFDSGDGFGFAPVGTNSGSWAPFTGTFDGQGHVISNLTVNRQSSHERALFGIAQFADIRNVGLENVEIAGNGSVGGLVGLAITTSISQVYVTGSVVGYNRTGGIVGFAKEGTTVTDSYTAAEVDSVAYCGLTVGSIEQESAILRTYSSGESPECEAVIVAAVDSSTISDSFFDCTVAGNCSATGAQSSTTLQTQSHYTTVGWDFDDVWAIDAPSTYPCLRWQEGCGDGPPVCDPTDATCDDVDDDCDESIDENYASIATSCGVGACASTGATSCVAGDVEDSCTPGTPASSDATCNSVDDDCNGVTDENYASTSTSCGTGACAATGTTSCVSGSVQSNCVPGQATASDPVCDAIDSDCDGSLDENYASSATTCGVGACASTGMSSCSQGVVLDNCTPCQESQHCGDGLDNDGNGLIDCADAACASSSACSPEICANTLDDDGDQLFDCADPDCAGEPVCLGLPPRAADVAPPLPPGVTVSVYNATRFLYAGPSPVQMFVDPAAIVPDRAVLIAGRVLDRSGTALPGVTIRVSEHTELGESTSDIDGNYFMVINGGGELSLEYQLHAHTTIHRTVRSVWNDSVAVDDVVMTPLDPVVSAVVLNGTSQAIQVARGSVITDADGTRQATVLLPPGVEAQMRMPNGSLEPLPSASLRVTEYTVGPNGPKAMVAPLPPNTIYTYAADFSFDEAVDAGAESVEFSVPVVTYVENFTDAPVGTAVPVGYYDRTGSRLAFSNSGWLPQENGIVLRLLSVTAGAADLDLTGTGPPASALELAALDITLAERQQIGALYQPGQTLWRVPRTHFSPADHNFIDVVGPLPDANIASEETSKSPCDEDAVGSRIGCFSQTLGEEIAITGTAYSLRYESNKHGEEDLAVAVEAIRSLPPGVRSVRVQLLVAGRRFEQEVPVLPSQTVTFNYDGRDAFGREIYGTHSAGVRVCYGVDAFAVAPPAATGSWWFADAALLGTSQIFIPRGNLTEVCRDFTTSVYRPIEGPIGGWDIDIQHLFDPVGRRVYKGDGRIQKGDYLHPLTTVAAGDGGKGREYCQQIAGLTDQQCGIGEIPNPGGAHIWWPDQIAPAADGTLYVTDHLSSGSTAYVLRIDPSGGSSRIFGRLPNGTNTTPATQLSVSAITGLAVGPDGLLYAAVPTVLAQNRDGYSFSVQIYRIAMDGSAPTIVAGSAAGSSADEIAATAAFLGGSASIAFGPDGSLFIAEPHRVRKVSPDGIIHTVAGRNTPSTVPTTSPHTVPMEVYFEPASTPLAARTLDFGRTIRDIAVAETGEVFVAATGGIYVVGVDGIVRLFAGGSTWYGPAQAGQAVPSSFTFSSIAIGHGATPTIYARANDGNVWEIANGLMFQLGSVGALPPEFRYQPGQTARRAFSAVEGLALHPDGNLLVGDRNIYRVIKLWLRGVPSKDTIVSADGSELWDFVDHRHVRTRDAVLGITRQSFGYDSGGRLASITDRYGSVTEILRDGSGRPTAIIPPLAPQTLLSTDSLGRLTASEDPEGGRYELTYHGSSRKLASYEQPDGALSSFEYDAVGRLVSDIDPELNTQTLERNATVVETPRSVTVEIERSLPGVGNPTIYREDLSSPNSVTTEVVDPSGAVKSTVSLGADMVSTTAPDGTMLVVENSIDPRLGSTYAYRTTTLLPSGLSRQVTEVRSAVVQDIEDPLSVTQVTTQVTTTDRGTETTIFDVPSRTIVHTSSEGREQTMMFDTMGRLISLAVPGLYPMMRQYDDRGRLEMATVEAGLDSRSIAFGYDFVTGYLTSTQGPASTDEVSFVNDLVGRTSSIESADGTLDLSYDDAGRLDMIVPPTGHAHSFSYSSRGLPTSYAAPELAPGVPNVTSSTYRPDRQVAQRTEADGSSVLLSYDSQTGALSEISSPNGQVSYAYDGLSGRIAEIQRDDLVGTHVLSYQYDGSLLLSENWGGDSVLTTGTVSRVHDRAFQILRYEVNGSPVVAYAYDGDGLLVNANEMTLVRDIENGLLTNTSLGDSTIAYAYNGFGEYEQISASHDGELLFEQRFTQRDSSGRILVATERIAPGMGAQVERSYQYDPMGRLTAITENASVVVSYGYDSNGNRSTKSSSLGTVHGRYDQQDRLLRYCPEDTAGGPAPISGLPCRQYSYNGRGQLQQITDISTGFVTSVSYEIGGALREIVLPDGRSIEYENDGLGRRVGKWVDGTKEWGMLYKDDIRPIAATNAAGSIVATFIYASRAHVPDLIETSTAVFRLVTDQIGSVRLVVDTANGSVVQRLDYDEFGNVLVDTNPGFQPFGFAGGLYDTDTGLERFGFRDYDAVTGRWTAKDPTLFAGGSTNLYQYADGNPINLVDPNGLDPSSEQCISLLEKIRNVEHEIQKRIGELDEDPLGLPEICEGDDKKPSQSKRGHRRLLNMHKANLAALKAMYLAKCGPPPGGMPELGKNVLDWEYWEEVTGLSGAALVAYLLASEGSRLFPPRNLIPVP